MLRIAHPKRSPAAVAMFFRVSQSQLAEEDVLYVAAQCCKHFRAVNVWLASKESERRKPCSAPDSGATDASLGSPPTLPRHNRELKSTSCFSFRLVAKLLWRLCHTTRTFLATGNKLSSVDSNTVLNLLGTSLRNDHPIETTLAAALSTDLHLAVLEGATQAHTERRVSAAAGLCGDFFATLQRRSSV